MPMANSMTKLLNLIERRLGTDVLGLPESMSKDKWATEVICNETLDVFSRYFPRKIPYTLCIENKKDDYWLIDESICNSVDIIGAGDIRWHDWSSQYIGLLFGGTHTFDLMSAGIDFETYADVIQMADHVSLYSNGMYIEYEPPNKIYLRVVVAQSFLTNFQRIPIDLFVKHAPNLKTIEPTKMNIFENLATADVANFLFEKLKYFDQEQLTFGNLDLKLQSLEETARSRQDIINTLESSYISAANRSMPILITAN